MACKCYHADRNFLGKIGVCWGTKECEACSCGGDESKCDFYDNVRKRATPKTTNADRIREMSDEELAEMFLTHDEQLYRHCPSDTLAEYCQVKPCVECCDCKDCWIEWLRQEVKND